MTRKDYKFIAGVLKEALESKELNSKAIKRFANALANENARFNRNRFYTACGIKIISMKEVKKNGFKLH